MATRLSTDVEVAEFVGQRLFGLWRASHTRIAGALKPLGLTPALFGLLDVLGAGGGAIQRQLSSDLDIDPSAMVTLIDELEGAGLAERRRYAGDRRAWQIAITSSGRRTLRRARYLATQAEDEVLGGLSAAERRQLATLLHRALLTAPAQPPWRSEEEDQLAREGRVRRPR